jgi:hypothetical protein
MADRIQEQLIDELLKDYKGPESFWGETGIFAQLKKRIIERTLKLTGLPVASNTGQGAAALAQVAIFVIF